jgi:hypothetical protein
MIDIAPLPAFFIDPGVSINKLPEKPKSLLPLDNVNSPPVFNSLDPAININAPPIPLLADPASISISPVMPSTLDPVSIFIPPVEPAIDMPVVLIMLPLFPISLESPLTISILPEKEESLLPEYKVMLPPDDRRGTGRNY